MYFESTIQLYTGHLVISLMFFFKIRVNSINPTAILTRLGMIGFGSPEQQEKTKSRIPMGQLPGTS